MSRKSTLLSRLYWYFGEAWYLLGLPRARWFSKDVKDGFGYAWHKDKIEGVSLLNRIRLWANANWKPWYNLLLSVVSMAGASLLYELGRYQLSAIWYGIAAGIALVVAGLYAIRPECQCKHNQEATNQDG